MRNELRAFFEGENIEFYTVLSYSDCISVREDIVSRAGIVPKSVVLMLIPYYAGKTVNLSVYAAARDYHIYIKQLGERLVSLLDELYPDSNSKAFGDHSPIDERHAALIGGLGILGDNNLLINEKYGTYVFISEIITDIEPTELSAKAPLEIGRCKGCGNCKRACPTGALQNYEAPCLSAITQRKGELLETEAELMIKYNTAWGCDICQSACPHNKNPQITSITFFRESRIEELTSELLGSMDEEEFSERAFAWRGRKTVERNLKVLKK